MDRLPNTHPGEVLHEEFLVPMNISAYRLAKETRLSQTRVSQIIHGKRSISADTALRLGKFFGVSPEFWLGLQNDHDLEEMKRSHGKQLDSMRTALDLKVSPPGRTTSHRIDRPGSPRSRSTGRNTTSPASR